MKKMKGFTLIEIIIYLAIISVMTVSLVDFALGVIQGGVKASNQQEVYTQARYLSERIKREIRSATDINSVSAGSISLKETPASGNDPTIISLSGTTVTIQQGAGPLTRLHSTDSKVTSLIFTSYTSADNKTKHIGFKITISANFGSLRHEYQESVNLEGSGELRSN